MLGYGDRVPSCWRGPKLAGLACSTLIMTGCGGAVTRGEGDGANPGTQDPSPTDRLVLTSQPREIFEWSAGSVGDPEVVARDGAFDLLVSVNVEKSGGTPGIQARRVEIGARGSSVQPGPVSVIAELAQGPPRAAVAGKTLAVCYHDTPWAGSPHLALRTFGAGSNYPPGGVASVSDEAQGCDGLTAVGGDLVTTTTTQSESLVQRWDAQGALVSETSPWPKEEASLAYTGLSAFDGGFAIAAALGPTNPGNPVESKSRIELRLFLESGQKQSFQFDSAVGSMRTPELSPWPYGPGGVAAVWREVSDDGTFQLRVAAGSVTGEVLLPPTTVASSLPRGTPARIGVVNQKLLVASILEEAPQSFQVSLRWIGKDGSVTDDFRLEARNAIGMTGADFAGLGDRVLLAWTTSEPGDAAFRWVKVNAALLQCP